MEKSENSIKELNALLEKAKSGEKVFKENLGNNTKSLVINKKGLVFLQEKGLKLENNYFSYRKSPLLYDKLRAFMLENGFTKAD